MCWRRRTKSFRRSQEPVVAQVRDEGPQKTAAQHPAAAQVPGFLPSDLSTNPVPHSKPALSPRPAIEELEGCCARASSSAKRRIPGWTGTDIALRSSSIKASNRRSATPISKPLLLLFSPLPPVPPPRPGWSEPRALYFHVAPHHPVHHPQSSSLTVASKSTTTCAQASWAHNLSWVKCCRQQLGLFLSHMHSRFVACHPCASHTKSVILAGGHSNLHRKTCYTSQFQCQKVFYLPHNIVSLYNMI